MKVYFAAPLFSAAEKAFNISLCEKLENIGFQVFLPQRDGIENTAKYSESEKEQRRKMLFEIDRDEIIKSDIFLFILDGRVPDEGACVELGIAYSDKYFNKSKKEIIGLQTDNRAAFLNSKLNPMIKMAFDTDRIFNNEKELLEHLYGKESR